jgi:hypothetical protein
LQQAFVLIDRFHRAGNGDSLRREFLHLRPTGQGKAKTTANALSIVATRFMFVTPFG